MDVSVDGDIRRGLLAAFKGESSEKLYDVIIDDSSHQLDHQIRIIAEAAPLLKPGGLLIVEDIFRKTADTEYYPVIKSVLESYPGSFAYFIDCEHQLKWSPDWDNDRLLILVKG
jgi:predicted O-methyltransferase YrrM